MAKDENDLVVFENKMPLYVNRMKYLKKYKFSCRK
jgi:hypothetical protein